MSQDDGNVISTIDLSPPKRIHLVGVGGTGMGSFAGMLKAAGHIVSGSDENVYPPMSDMLRIWGIDVMTPYAEENVDRSNPELVVIGNVIRRANVEATAVRNQMIPQMSFPAALGSLFLSKRHSIVVVGTHGKTTTSSLMGHVLVSAARDPSFLVGGVTQNYRGNYRLGSGPHFVVEGDEYDTAYFDKGPKFLHYRAKTIILTSVEFDHADIYRDMAHYESAFARLFAEAAPDTNVVVSATWPNAVALARAAKGRVQTYSSAPGISADYTARNVHFDIHGVRFEVMHGDRFVVEVVLPMSGSHNVENALGVFAAAESLGLTPQEISRGLSSFSGVKRRQEVRGEPSGILIIDDFAHHPTAVRETIAAIARRYAPRPVWAVFEPRSNTSRRNIHQDDYAASFGDAHRVSIKIPERHDKIPVGEELDVVKLAADLNRQGIRATAGETVETIVGDLVAEAKTGDVVLVMSNGSFGGLVDRLLTKLEGST